MCKGQAVVPTALNYEVRLQVLGRGRAGLLPGQCSGPAGLPKFGEELNHSVETEAKSRDA
jgi:hypothetical protein